MRSASAWLARVRESSLAQCKQSSDSVCLHLTLMQQWNGSQTGNETYSSVKVCHKKVRGNGYAISRVAILLTEGCFVEVCFNKVVS